MGKLLKVIVISVLLFSMMGCTVKTTKAEIPETKTVEMVSTKTIETSLESKPAVSQSVIVSETGEIIPDTERTYKCQYVENDGISLTLNGNDVIIADVCEITMYTKGSEYDVISYLADTEFYIDDNFSIGIAESEVDKYDLLDEDGDIIGYVTCDKDNHTSKITDTYDRLVAVCDYGSSVGYTVTAYDNRVCSDTTIIMLSATYAMVE